MGTMRISNADLNHLKSINHTGWFTLCKSGLLEFEGASEWDSDNVIFLGLFSGKMIFLLPEGKKGYFQSKTASSSPGSGTNLESRNIGYREGNSEIVLRVSEDTNICSLEVGDI